MEEYERNRMGVDGQRCGRSESLSARAVVDHGRMTLRESPISAANATVTAEHGSHRSSSSSAPRAIEAHTAERPSHDHPHLFLIRGVVVVEGTGPPAIVQNRSSRSLNGLMGTRDARPTVVVYLPWLPPVSGHSAARHAHAPACTLPGNKRAQRRGVAHNEWL